MAVGLGLVALQVYLWLVAATRGRGHSAWVVALLAAAALIITTQVALMFRLRGSQRSLLAYPIGFAGTVLGVALLSPVVLGAF